MTQEELIQGLAVYFPGLFSGDSPFTRSKDGQVILQRLLKLPIDPVTHTHFNSLLHIARERGVSAGFFKFYFLCLPPNHPHNLERLFPAVPGLDEAGISSLDQLRWGIHRFFVDALLYFPSIRSAYEHLSQKTYQELEQFFSDKRFDSQSMRARGPVLDFEPIRPEDRYLVAEVACKAYSPVAGDRLFIEEALFKAYKERGGGRVMLKTLYGAGSQLAENDPNTQMILEFAAEEFADDTVDTEDEIREKIRNVAARFAQAQEAALANTRLYLSIVNELDVYVATSMRRRADFRQMARDCELIFGQDGLRRFRIRYFDPTLSATRCHEDKGLTECLMVKCAKALLYFAGDRDSFGKDAEVSMALSLGKPVIILCPSGPRGQRRMEFFRDIHPLSRMVQMDRGMAVGAMVANDPLVAARLLERLFDNRMEYDLEQMDRYFRLKERLTGSVVRFETNDGLLRHVFSTYYRSES